MSVSKKFNKVCCDKEDCYFYKERIIQLRLII